MVKSLRMKSLGREPTHEILSTPKYAMPDYNASIQHNQKIADTKQRDNNDNDADDNEMLKL